MLGKIINFTLGNQSASGITNTNGIAWAIIKLNQVHGLYDVRAKFLGDANYFPSQDNETFNITR